MRTEHTQLQKKYTVLYPHGTTWKLHKSYDINTDTLNRQLPTQPLSRCTDIQYTIASYTIALQLASGELEGDETENNFKLLIGPEREVKKKERTIRKKDQNLNLNNKWGYNSFMFFFFTPYTIQAENFTPSKGCYMSATASQVYPFNKSLFGWLRVHFLSDYIRFKKFNTFCFPS